MQEKFLLPYNLDDYLYNDIIELAKDKELKKRLINDIEGIKIKTNNIKELLKYYNPYRFNDKFIEYIIYFPCSGAITFPNGELSFKKDEFTFLKYEKTFIKHNFNIRIVNDNPLNIILILE
jgi:hypothetical protein